MKKVMNLKTYFLCDARFMMSLNTVNVQADALDYLGQYN